jgi:hypothetical protein
MAELQSSAYTNLNLNLPKGAAETLEDPAILRENGPVIVGVDWLHGDQAVWFW